MGFNQLRGAANGRGSSKTSPAPSISCTPTSHLSRAGVSAGKCVSGGEKGTDWQAGRARGERVTGKINETPLKLIV